MAGARKVYAVEQNEAIELALELCASNGFTDCIEFVKDRSQNLALAERVDVIVTDTGASFGLQDGMLGALIDARARLLKPGGQIIPQSVDLFVSPVELNDSHSLDIWNKDRCGLDLSPIRRFAANTNYHVLLEREDVLAAPALLTTLRFHDIDSHYVCGESVSRIERMGVVHGLGGWISVNLVPGLSFTNSPIKSAERSVSWRQSLFPIETPVSVQPGDWIRTRISTHDGQAWRWQIEITHGDPTGSAHAPVKARFDHSTLENFPVRIEQLRKKLPDHAPRLSRKGIAESYVLNAFDGRHTVQDLTEDILTRFGDCFPTKTAATDFVRRIVERCT
jgi:hypothetical protein